MTDVTSFVQAFKEATPYINNLRGKTVVVGINSYAASTQYFADIMQDIVLLNNIGLYLVLVFDVSQEALPEQHTVHISQAELEVIKTAIGRTQIDIEACLSMGYPNLSISRSRMDVVSSNYVVAKSQGVINGRDAAFLGKVRSIQLDLLRRHLLEKNIVLIKPMGYSISGISYYIPMSELASRLAIALKAEKLLFLTRAKGIVDKKDHVLNNLTVEEVKRQWVVQQQHPDIVSIFPAICETLASREVKRVQLVPFSHEGALVAELFTRNGIGTSLSYDSFTHVRVAKNKDIPSILTLVEPLVEAGTLIKRSRRYFEAHINEFCVVVYDEVMCGCAQLKPYEGEAAELACLAVSPLAQDTGYGEQLLACIEKLAKLQGKTQLFALTTQTADWFEERGFIQVSAEQLPKERLLEYQKAKRQSKVLLKHLMK